MKHAALMLLSLVAKPMPSLCEGTWSVQRIIDTCTNHNNRICDPDGILSEKERKKLGEQINHLEDTCLVKCNNSDENENVQMTIVIVSKFDEANMSTKDDTAEIFATTLHNRWGVGNVICGKSTGVLLFVSILDRAMFISTSNGVEPILTRTRLESIMEQKMKSYLKERKYAEALEEYIRTVEEYFAKGPPSFWEVYFVVVLLSIIACGFKVDTYIEKGKKREYALVHSQLTKLDREKAMVLMGKYKCTSCPICLEDFRLVSNVAVGHREEERVASKKEKYLGSDGKPIQVLKCGHAFDVSCWENWITKGSAGFDGKCPICRHDIKPSAASTTQPDVNANETVHPETSHNDIDNTVQRRYRYNAGNDNDNTVQLRRRYNDERKFRLIRLMARHPRYIRTSQLERWSSDYQGDLVRDQDFVRRDPSIRANENNGTGGSNTYRGRGSYGGGSSSGGCGGSW